MDKSTGDITKRKRPPAAGIPILVRLQPDLLAKIDTYRWEGTSRPETIREILEEWFDNHEW